jgi:hypothetical protein
VRLLIYRSPGMREIIDVDLWQRAFKYAVKNLQIKHFHGELECIFTTNQEIMEMEGKDSNGFAGGSLERGELYLYVAADCDNIIETFFHEMTHIKQILKGELKHVSPWNIWKGKKWNKRELKRYHGLTLERYNEVLSKVKGQSEKRLCEVVLAPWEIEACRFAEKHSKLFKINA